MLWLLIWGHNEIVASSAKLSVGCWGGSRQTKKHPPEKFLLKESLLFHTPQPFTRSIQCVGDYTRTFDTLPYCRKVLLCPSRNLLTRFLDVVIINLRSWWDRGKQCQVIGRVLWRQPPNKETSLRKISFKRIIIISYSSALHTAFNVLAIIAHTQWLCRVAAIERGREKAGKSKDLEK